MDAASIGLLIIAILIVITILSSLRICSEWERKVVLRLGRFGGVRGPGVFFLLPYIEQTPFTIDTRVVTTPFQAEQTLTIAGVIDRDRLLVLIARLGQCFECAAQLLASPSACAQPTSGDSP